MSISGLVVVLTSNEAERDAALAAIERDPRLEVGERAGNRLAVVADTDSQESDIDVWKRLHALPGVVAVEVAFVSFDDAPFTAGNIPRNRASRESVRAISPQHRDDHGS